MDTTPHDAVIPYDDVNAEKQIKKFLQEKFEKENWWTKNKYFSSLVIVLYLICIFYWALTGDFEGMSSRYGPALIPIILLGISCTFAPLMFVMTVMKYFIHDIPLNKYKEEWSLQESN